MKSGRDDPFVLLKCSDAKPVPYENYIINVSITPRSSCQECVCKTRSKFALRQSWHCKCTIWYDTPGRVASLLIFRNIKQQFYELIRTKVHTLLIFLRIIICIIFFFIVYVWICVSVAYSKFCARLWYSLNYVIYKALKVNV